MSFPNPFKRKAVAEAERRAITRIYSEIPATLFADDTDPIDCTLLDYSDMGARLQVADGARFPDRFKLFVPETEMTYVAEVRRRGACEAGIFFVSAEHGKHPWKARR